MARNIEELLASIRPPGAMGNPMPTEPPPRDMAPMPTQVPRRAPREMLPRAIYPDMRPRRGQKRRKIDPSIDAMLMQILGRGR